MLEREDLLALKATLEREDLQAMLGRKVILAAFRHPPHFLPTLI